MSYYDTSYFDWQRHVGAFGGKANLFKFIAHIKPTDKVLDFGSGGGFLLAQINCQEKKGIEINPVARQNAIEQGIDTIASIEEVADEWADVIISNHALEHVFQPLDELKKLHKKLKKGGKIIFVVPHEVRAPYRPNDINQHIYTWSPMCLGNLFHLAGYEIIEAHSLKHRWMPYYMQVRKYTNESVFNILCRLYARWKGDLYQTRVVARKN